MGKKKKSINALADGIKAYEDKKKDMQDADFTDLESFRRAYLSPILSGAENSPRNTRNATQSLPHFWTKTATLFLLKQKYHLSYSQLHRA